MSTYLLALLIALTPTGLAAAHSAALPIFFMPNAGQVSSAVRFMVQTPDVRAGFTAHSVLFQIHNREIEVQFAGSNPMVSIDGTDLQRGHVNFFIGSNSTT